MPSATKTHGIRFYRVPDTRQKGSSLSCYCAMRSLPCAVYGKVFTVCFRHFVVCLRHTAKLLNPVVIFVKPRTACNRARLLVPAQPGLSSCHISRSRATPSPPSAAELARDSIAIENSCIRRAGTAAAPATSLIRVIAAAPTTNGGEQEELAARPVRKT